MFKIIFIGLAATVFATHSAAGTCQGRDLWRSQSAQVKASIDSAAAKVPFGDGRFFEISKNGKTSYMFGTMHVPPFGKLRIPKIVLQKLEGSQRLFVEVTDVSSDNYWNQIHDDEQEYFSETPTNFSRYFSAGQWKNLQRRAKSRGLSKKALDHMQPWYLYLSLAGSGCEDEFGANRRSMDSKLEQIARSAGISVQSLETPPQAFGALKGFSPSQFAKMTNTVIASNVHMRRAFKFDGGDMFQTGYNFYARGQIQHIMQWNQYIMSQGPDKSGMSLQRAYTEDAMLKKRNNNWMPQVLRSVKAGDTFIAVGAFHLGGSYGLLTKLHRKGYKITRIKLVK